MKSILAVVVTGVASSMIGCASPQTVPDSVQKRMTIVEAVEKLVADPMFSEKYAMAISQNGGLQTVYENRDQKIDNLFAKNPKLFWIGIGKTDFLYSNNTALRGVLDSKKHKYTYMETEGGHIWRNWRIYLSEFVPLLFK